MKARPYAILAATALLGSQTSTLSAKEAEVEIRRALPVKDLRRGRGADDAATATPDVRQGRGADDAATATPDLRQSRRADDAALNVNGTPHIRQARGADDVIANASGALVPTAAALSAPAQTTPPSSGREDKVTFGAAQQAAQTAGLAPAAVHRRNGKHHILEVGVTGFDKVPSAGTADLENGEIIGNLPDKQRLRFALYANAQQAQAAAALWAAPAAQEKREDGAAVASETGIIAWDDQSGADDKGTHQAGRIMGLFLHSDRMPELNDDFLRGKVIQIYGPQVNALDVSGKPFSSTRQVYWTSDPIR